MNTCADKLQRSIDSTSSHLVAGCDPVIEKLPTCIIENAKTTARTDAEFFERALRDFSEIFVSAIAGRVAAAKPNIAFFEQYGLPGLTAFSSLCDALRAHNVPVIIDAKRGDIGSTAAAYSAAFLGQSTVLGRNVRAFQCDALTVNPYLGFDTLEPFLKDCRDHGKGIFVLVQTSNPGAKDLQGLRVGGESVSDHVARWIATNAAALQGSCGWSGLGAVVGASYPEDAQRLRQLMPDSFFLIPGLGAQGASARDSIAGFGLRNGKRGGALINVSRGLLEGSANSKDELVTLITRNAMSFNAQIRDALATPS
jgi:orotidine-5'-phosphate decarboxylase